MIDLKTTIIAFSAAIMVSIASISGFQLTETIAEESEDKGYVFAEEVAITGLFKFMDATEMYQFEVFNQASGFQSRDAYTFELEKIVGTTPYLHKAADFSYMYRNSPADQKTDYEFDAEIILSKGGEQKRVFQYYGCFVKDYAVSTDFDKEEGWMGKGFAVKDNFEIQCDRYEPLNPILEDMMSNKEKASAKSSMQYQSEQRDLR